MGNKGIMGFFLWLYRDCMGIQGIMDFSMAL